MSSPRLPAELPEPLAERCRPVGDSSAPVAGGFVLYWMRTALRGHENPALDVALEVGAALDLPVFVYQGLSQRYPFASDRHHTFILEGARDAAGELDERGVGHALHVERPGHDGPVLAELAAEAALVVTEEMPVAPLAGWTRHLAGAVDAPVIAVDTACVVPMPLTESAFERAFEFRRATAAARRQRLTRPWAEAEVRHRAFTPRLPFTPIDPRTMDVAALVGECEIDHSVAPVPHTRGGATAGYTRWADFRDQKLARYAGDRNDPLRDGVSRLSPYLHYGMISPLAVAREAAERGGKGAEKFLDELLVWRELAYHFCFHRPEHATVEALPGWARQGLERHEKDPRPQAPSWETLARGRTGDALWDAAQTSLARHGELHNNVRMTWGKALLAWTPDAGRALALLEDLNHRFALDGRDPASYGGILWCLGQFDRPFKPDQPILGPVRTRPTSGHARRLDVGRYRERCYAPAVPSPPRTLVIGGGLAGLACARTLLDAGFEVRVLDKGRGPGGRASTRRADGAGSPGSATFDHGAQYFTIRDRRFEPWLRSWVADGVAARWEGKIGTLERGEVGPARGAAERWVGVPGMSALARHLAADLEVESGVRVTALERTDGGWTARDDAGGEHRADLAVLALPAPQARELLAADDPLAAAIAGVVMAPCLAAMIHLASPWDLELDGAFVSDSPLSWMARDSSKPGRPPGERWVLHAGPGFSREHLERPSAEIAELLLAAARRAAGRELPEVVEARGHRWRWALTETPLGRDALLDADRRLGVCGDWCPGARIEGALTSGVALAGEILRAAAGDAAAASRSGAGGSGRATGPGRRGDRAAQLRLDLAGPAAGRRGGSAP